MENVGFDERLKKWGLVHKTPLPQFPNLKWTCTKVSTTGQVIVPRGQFRPKKKRPCMPQFQSKLACTLENYVLKSMCKFDQESLW